MTTNIFCEFCEFFRKTNFAKCMSKYAISWFSTHIFFENQHKMSLEPQPRSEVVFLSVLRDCDNKTVFVGIREFFRKRNVAKFM